MYMLRDILDDETYDRLIVNHLLDPVKVRNHFIKMKYDQLKKEGIKTRVIIEIILKELPYLNEVYLRQIFYRKS